MTHKDYFDKKLKISRTFLNRWVGANAKIWEFSNTHTHLTIRLEKPGVKGNLHIICIEPLYYKGPFQWENNHIETEISGEVFILKDLLNDIEIKCTDIEPKENCNPIY